MAVSEKRRRIYREYRRRYPTTPARVAAWASSEPRYDVSEWDDDQKVLVNGEVYRAEIVVDDDAPELFREELENGWFTVDDMPFVTYYVVVVTHQRSGLSASVGGVCIDDRVYRAERYLQDEVCDGIDEVRGMLAHRPSVFV